MKINVSPLINQPFIWITLELSLFYSPPDLSLYLESAANTPSGITRNLEIIKVDQVHNVV